jgi:hypothetical protein
MLGITSSKCTVSRTILTFPRGRSNFRLAPRCLREINARTMVPMPEESSYVTSARLTNILSAPSSTSCGRSSNSSQPHYFSQTLQRKRDTTAEVGQSRQWRSGTSVYSCRTRYRWHTYVPGRSRGGISCAWTGKQLSNESWNLLGTVHRNFSRSISRCFYQDTFRSKPVSPIPRPLNGGGGERNQCSKFAVVIGSERVKSSTNEATAVRCICLNDMAKAFPTVWKRMHEHQLRKSKPYRSVANARTASDANSSAALRQTIAVSFASTERAKAGTIGRSRLSSLGFLAGTMGNPSLMAREYIAGFQTAEQLLRRGASRYS